MRHFSIALLLVASTASAADWQSVANLDSNGGVMFVDAAAITEVKGFRKAWFKSVYTSDQPIPEEYQAAVRNARTYRWVQSLGLFNCAERTSSVAQFSWNSADDKNVGSYRHELLTFRQVAAGTPDEKLLDTVCKAEKVEPEVPFEELAKMKRPANPDDFYPPESRHRKEQGSPIVQVCVGPSGKLLRDPVVTDTSGFPALDGAAIKVARATQYAAGKKNGTALPESCMKFKIKFVAR